MQPIRKYLLIPLLLICSMYAYAQISPGDLSKAHAELEGMGNCTKCHELGAKVSDQKCLNCHTEIKNLMQQDRGFHVSSEVANKSCVQCHNDHHGRNFDMVRFDEQKFNHNDAGYALEGAHKQVDCRECHTPNNIADRKTKALDGTYLGLETSCLSCHDDFHQNTLSTDCLSCHGMDAFTPVTSFKHDETNFKLLGEHVALDCIECHKTTTKNGKEFQQFTQLAFEDCKSCHNDPHNNQLPGTCTQCHNEDSFSTFIGKGSFNHNRTDFSLNGKHNVIDCFSCHVKTSSTSQVFQDKIVAQENECIACHQDPHDNKYEQDCAKCHSEKSFLKLKDMDFFDHSITDFALEGKHLGVDCRKCHIERFSTAIDFTSCNNCHTDYHNREFEKNSITPDCNECHSLQEAFDYTSYTITDHQATSFPLEGAHVATPCFACHVDEADNRWTFANLGDDCIECHTNIHEGFLPKEYIPQNDCASCHGNESWDLISFDHNTTDWPLTGNHLAISCSACHFELSDNKAIISQNFSNLETSCVSCHENTHDDLFAIEGVTDCNRCHVTSSWLPEKFDHNATRFPLTGKHTEVNCKECHQTNNQDGTPVIKYKLNTLECIDCHS